MIKLPDGYITYAEAAKRIGRAKTEVSRYVREGRLTACKRGPEYQYCCGVLAKEIDELAAVPIVIVKKNPIK